MIVKHPRIPNLEANVPEADVAGWVAQGWVSDEPPAPAPEQDEDEDEATPEPPAPRQRRSK